MPLIIPELIIKDTLETILNFLKEDCADESSDSFLAELLEKDEFGKTLKFNRFNYLEQARKVFSDSLFDEDDRPKIYLGYNMTVSKLISLHIILPSEQSDALCLGADEGYQGYDVSKDGKKFAPIYTMTADGTYQIIITSENSSEVVLVYHVIRACLVSMNDNLEFQGFKLPRVGGGDLNIQQESFVPPNIFHRALSLNFKYEINVSSIPQRLAAKKIILQQLLEDGNGDAGISNTNVIT